ncbi:MAG: hypothetical protein D6798_07755, partial [Deltaproteobacteria bacterium]
MKTRIGTVLGFIGMLVAGACGRDPILERADELGEEASAARGGGRPGGGVPVDPPPGDPADPPPGRSEPPA